LITADVRAQLLEVYNMLCRLTNNHFQAERFVIKHWLIPWEPGDDSLGHNLMAYFTSLVITCELLYSVPVDDKLLADHYWLWCMICVKLETDRPCQCVVFLQPKPPWPYLDPTISPGFANSLHIIGTSVEFNQFVVASCQGSRTYSCLDFVRKLMVQQFFWLLGLCRSCHQYVTEDATYFGSPLLEWNIPWYPCLAILLYNWLQMQAVGGRCKFYVAFLFSWDVDNTIDSVLTIKHIASLFSLTLQTLELGNHVSVAVLLSSQLSHVSVLYLPSTSSITQWGTKMMPCENARTDCILTYAKRVCIPWNPGGSDHDLAATWNLTQLQLQSSHLKWGPGGVKLQFLAMAFLVWLVMPWDPGGSVWCRLEVKPTFKEGGLSATYLNGPADGRPPWAMACLGSRHEGVREHIYLQSGYIDTRLGTGRKRRLRPRLVREEEEPPAYATSA
jgi:hypothetical protein